MTQVHINTVLPIKNRVLAADENTAFLAHYDLNEHDVLRNVKAVGGASSLNTDGSTTYLRIPNIVKNASSFTISFWIKNNSTVAWTDILTFDTNVDGTACRIEKDSSPSGYRWYSEGGFVNGTLLFTHDGSQWDHITLMSDGTNVFSYQNGIQVYAGSKSGTNLPTCDYINVGRRLFGSYWRGSIKDLTFYNRALSQDEIKSSISNKFAESGLIGQWKFNEGQGIIVRDSSPFHNDATINGTVSWSAGNSVFTLRPQEGYFGGGAIASEESTANLYTSIGVIDASNTLSESEWNEKYNGNRIVRITKTQGTPSAHASYRQCVNAPPSGVTTLSFKVKILSGDISSITSHYGGGTTSISAIKTKLRDGWWLCEWSGYTPESGVLCVGVGFYGDAPVDCLITEMQVEEKAFATSFTNGGRALSNLSYDMKNMGVDPLGDWTISGWFKRHPNPTGWASIFGIGNYHKIGESEFTVWTNHSGRIYAHVHDNRVGSGAIILTANVGELEEWFFVAVTHNSTSNEFKIHVWTKDRSVSGSFIDVLEYPMTPNLYIGGSSSSSHVFNGLIDEVRIDKVARTDEEIMAWYQSNSPFWPRGIYRKSY